MKSFAVTTLDGGQFGIGGVNILSAIQNCGIDPSQIISIREV